MAAHHDTAEAHLPRAGADAVDAAPLGACTGAAGLTVYPKPWITGLARVFLLPGHVATLMDGDDGRPLLIVSRGAWTKSFTDLQALDEWLHRIAGTRAEVD